MTSGSRLIIVVSHIDEDMLVEDDPTFNLDVGRVE